MLSFLIQFLRTLGTALFWVMVFFAGLWVLIVFIGAGNPIVAPLTIPLLALSIATAIHRHRCRRVAMVLAYLEQAVRLNLPLPLMLLAAEHRETATVRPKLRVLRRWIEQGAPIDLALSHALPDTPRRIVAAVGAAERIGRLPQVLRTIVDHLLNQARRDDAGKAFMQNYAIAVVMFVGGVLAFLGWLVIPKIEMIFEDFGSQMPWATQVTIEMFHSVGAFGVMIPLAIVLGIIFWLGSESLKIAGWLSGGPWLPGRSVIDFICYHTPVLRDLCCKDDLAMVCSLAADGLDVGLPAHEAIRQAGDGAGNTALRRRMHRWAMAIEAGAAPGDAAMQARLPRIVSRMVAGESGQINLPQNMRFLARYYQSRLSPIAAMLGQLSGPFFVLLTSLVVAWVCYALMLPLVMLIEHNAAVAL